MDILLWTLCALFILIGLIGTILPMIPGSSFIFFGLVCGAWADNFEKVGWMTISILGILTALTFTIDFLTTKLGVEKTGASALATTGALVGSLLGVFFGIVGIFILPFLGAALGEYIIKKDLLQAGKVGIGTWLGLVFGIALKLGVNYAMIGLFCLAYFI